MHGGKSLPLTREDSSMHDTVVEMSAKRLGVVGVTDAAVIWSASSPMATFAATSSAGSIIPPASS